MELNNKLISNRSEFIDNFSLEGVWNKVNEVCDFFEESVVNISDREKILINILKNNGTIDELAGFEFKYADGSVLDCEGTAENKRLLTKIVILLELGQCRQAPEISKFMLNSAAVPGANEFSGSVGGNAPLSALVDVTQYPGTINLEAYNFGCDESISETNRIYTRTYVNNSADESSWVGIEIYDSASKSTKVIRLHGGEALTASFAKEKLIGFFPVMDFGMGHMVAGTVDGSFYCLGMRREISRRYSGLPDDIFYFSATNDGALFISASEGIILFSDSQISFDLPLSDGERPIMACAREQRYAVLTNFGNLHTGMYGQSYANVCYVTMRANGLWCALTADNKLIGNMNGDKKISLEAASDIEELLYKSANTDSLNRLKNSLGTDSFSHIGISGEHSATRLGGTVRIFDKKENELRYDL